ncbi:hypothetical protein QCA50_004091 [Cerrena zonata]|uniref:4a-hydroxytetrahydrobiopterin dehydratase n=1 Tax=Cerrena zonata TaxID=2478898 RepID=A0AAW0GGD4_9APHY
MSSAAFLRRVSLCSRYHAAPPRLTNARKLLSNHPHSRQASSATQLKYGSEENPIDVSSHGEYEQDQSDPEALYALDDPDAFMNQGLHELDPRRKRLEYRGKPRDNTPKWYDPMSSPSIKSGSPYEPEEYLNQQLPSLPDKPKYPCPHLVDEEVEQYLFPLYARLWSLTRCEIEWNGVPRTPFMLSKTIEFPTFSSGLEFVKDIEQKIEEEQHHPKIIIDGTRITISTHTHSAIIPDVSPQERTSPYRKFPGVTLRDTRLATEVELVLERHIFVNSNISSVPIPSGQHPISILEYSGYRIPSPETSFVGEEYEPAPSDISDMLSALPLHSFVDHESHLSDIPAEVGKFSIRVWRGETINKPVNKLKCQACGGKHALPTCKERHLIQPKGPCKLCDGNHWLVDCPLYVRGKPKML